mgnify:CR=1 FL=1|jgi:hypothetical protein
MTRYLLSITVPGAKRPWSIDPAELSQPCPAPPEREEADPDPDGEGVAGVASRVVSGASVVKSVSAPQDAQKRPSGTVAWQAGHVTTPF